MTICRTLIIAYRINKLGHTECPAVSESPCDTGLFDSKVIKKEEFEKRAIKKATQSRLQELR